MSKQAYNCSQCAYVQREGNNMWCPFHDIPVSGSLVCNDYLDEFKTPLYTALTNEKSKVSLAVIIKDIIAYSLITGLILLAAICTYGILSQ